MRVHIYPEFKGEDRGDGGVRRIVEAQRTLLPVYGCEVVASPDAADLIAIHIAAGDRLLERFPQKPIVVHNHGLYFHEHDWRAKWYQKANTDCMEALRQADAITAPSEWVAQALRRNTLRQVTVIGHGVNLEEWPLPASHKGFVLWNKTRVDPVCDPEPLNRLAKMVPDVSFVTTFGDDSLPNVGVTGKLPYETAKQAVRDAAVYLCTAGETFGIGTLEAMAACVPVLGWAWGGQVNIVGHKVTGWLATPGDFDGLLEGLRYCLAHRDEMGQAARAVVEQRYGWEHAVRAYAELYERVLAEKTQERPAVSVIVPAYGLEQFLPEALDSVLAQEGDWECIVVDDASPDRCGSIADSYAARDTRFRVIHNAENQYLAGALNTGIAASRGRYILPLDADNRLPENTLQLLSRQLDIDRSIHIAYGNVQFVLENGAPDTSVGPDGRSGWPMQFRGDWQLKRQNKDRRPVNLVPSTSMYRREVWELTGGYRRRFRTAEDADFWTRAASYGFRPRMVTQAVTLLYRQRADSMGRREETKDWTAWLPWCREAALPPAAVISEEQASVPSYEPPAITVVIPVGPEHREMVIDAIDSVDAQTFRQWELVVVNDSGAPLRWVPSWVKVVETGGCVGVAAARNAGIEAARGSLFVPLDADDALEPEALAVMERVWREFRGYVYCDFYEQWQGKERTTWTCVVYRCQGCNRLAFEGEFVDGRCPKCEGSIGDLVADGYQAELLLKKGCLHAVTGLFTKEAWKAVGGYDVGLAWEDWDFQLKLADAGICGTRIPEPLFTYRKDTGLRREENYAEFEKSKDSIVAKWGPYFEGRKKLMACGGCPGGGGGRVAPRSSQVVRSAAPPPTEDVVVVEYVGPKLGAMTFRGPSSTTYRFSARPTEKQKYVRRDDAEFFAMKADFVVRQPNKPDSPTVGQKEAVPA